MTREQVGYRKNSRLKHVGAEILEKIGPYGQVAATRPNTLALRSNLAPNWYNYPISVGQFIIAFISSHCIISRYECESRFNI